MQTSKPLYLSDLEKQSGAFGQSGQSLEEEIHKVKSSVLSDLRKRGNFSDIGFKAFKLYNSIQHICFLMAYE